MLWKSSQIRFTSPSIHLRRVGYYRKVAEQSEAQKGGNVTETPSLVMSHTEQNILQQCHIRYLQTVENFLSKIFLDPNKHRRKKSLSDFMHLEEFRRKLSTTHLSKICRKFSLVSFKMCRTFSVENIGVENFPLKMEKWPVENFLSKIVMFATFLSCVCCAARAARNRLHKNAHITIFLASAT